MRAAERPIRPSRMKNCWLKLAEAIGMVRAFLDDGGSPLDDVINKTDFEQIAAIAACKEVRQRERRDPENDSR